MASGHKDWFLINSGKVAVTKDDIDLFLDSVEERIKNSDSVAYARLEAMRDWIASKEGKARQVEADPEETALNVQIGGDHYKNCKIQPIQYIEANKLEFLEGCIVKRVTRHNKPTGKGRQDIEKSIHELQLLLELRYSDND